MLDRDFFRTYRPLPSPFWEWVGAHSWRTLEKIAGTKVVFENFEPPSTPVVFATNSTQKYDFMPIRVELERRKIPTVTITKGKNYHSAVGGFLLSRLGVLPIVSRGYVLMVDFTSVLKRRPSESEYRALRSHLDEGLALPAELNALRDTRRTLLGHDYEPPDYRALLQRVYAGAMSETVRLAREAVAAGSHVHIYPEGTVSTRLGTGRIGAVQLAHALRLPIVPVGMSGCREAMFFRGGPITIRFGKPIHVSLPNDLKPFDPEDEKRHRNILLAATEQVMAGIDALLEPAQQRREGFTGDGTQGTKRFL